jgi:hypothetical protein
LGVHRSLLVRVVQQRGARFIDPDYDGTDEQAIADLMDGPELICTCPCRKGPLGECTGEPAEGGPQ